MNSDTPELLLEFIHALFDSYPMIKGESVLDYSTRIAVINQETQCPRRKLETEVILSKVCFSALEKHLQPDPENLDLLFINEICVAYYHCNSGQNLRNY